MKLAKNQSIHLDHLGCAPGVVDGPGQDDPALAVDDEGAVVVGDGARARRGEHEEKAQRVPRRHELAVVLAVYQCGASERASQSVYIFVYQK